MTVLPDLPELARLAQVLLACGLLVLIFLGVNRLALAAADARNRRRR